MILVTTLKIIKYSRHRGKLFATNIFALDNPISNEVLKLNSIIIKFQGHNIIIALINIVICCVTERYPSITLQA